MFKFNYESFKNSLNKSEQDASFVLKDDIEKVKACVEKALAMFLESSANMSETNYPGLEA
jgi:hypothetical protein